MISLNFSTGKSFCLTIEFQIVWRFKFNGKCFKTVTVQIHFMSYETQVNSSIVISPSSINTVLPSTFLGQSISNIDPKLTISWHITRKFRIFFFIYSVFNLAQSLLCCSRNMQYQWIVSEICFLKIFKDFNRSNWGTSAFKLSLNIFLC